MANSKSNELPGLVINAIVNLGQLRGTQSTELINYIVEKNQVPEEEAKDVVRAVLQNGLVSGSLVKDNNVYLVKNISDLVNQCSCRPRRRKRRRRSSSCPPRRRRRRPSCRPRRKRKPSCRCPKPRPRRCPKPPRRCPRPRPRRCPKPRPSSYETDETED